MGQFFWCRPSVVDLFEVVHINRDDADIPAGRAAKNAETARSKSRVHAGQGSVIAVSCKSLMMLLLKTSINTKPSVTAQTPADKCTLSKNMFSLWFADDNGPAVKAATEIGLSKARRHVIAVMPYHLKKQHDRKTW